MRVCASCLLCELCGPHLGWRPWGNRYTVTESLGHPQPVRGWVMNRLWEKRFTWNTPRPSLPCQLVYPGLTSLLVGASLLRNRWSMCSWGKMFNRENLVESRSPWQERFLYVANSGCNSFRPMLSPHPFILVLQEGERFLSHQVCHVTMMSASLPATTSWFHIIAPHQRPERCTDQLPSRRHPRTRLNWCEQEGVHAGPPNAHGKRLCPVRLCFRGNP